MPDSQAGRVAILYPGDLEIRRKATRENNRFATIFSALSDAGIKAEPAVYHDDFSDEVRRQLLEMDAVLVWMNPIQDGRDRSMLDAMLSEIAGQGIYVSAHPEIILKMGTKQVLYDTREMGWGSDTHVYGSLDEMRAKLPRRLARDGVRVLKQYRGNGGLGVWKLELMQGGSEPQPEDLIRVRHAKKGALEEQIPLSQFYDRCQPYFSGQGRMIDQAYQARLPEGMVRCYLVQDKIAGFGHQAVNALYPAPPGAPPSEAPQPGPRLYHPPDLPQFQALKRKVEQEWVPEMQRLLDISTGRLPMLWDCDFLLGPKDAGGQDTHVLCEINVSSVAPYPESAAAYVAQATLALLRGP